MTYKLYAVVITKVVIAQSELEAQQIANSEKNCLEEDTERVFEITSIPQFVKELPFSQDWLTGSPYGTHQAAGEVEVAQILRNPSILNPF